MNIATATPAQIDTEINDLQFKLAKAGARIDGIDKLISKAREGRYTPITEDEAFAQRNPLVAEVLRNRDLLAPLLAEYRHRGGWTRYYLVQGGHLHHDISGFRCSRVSTTVHVWMTELSGQDATEVVELAGERACTVCFPTAPVNVLKQASRLYTPEEREAAEARGSRADAAARKAQDRASKAIAHPDGKPLLDAIDWKVETEAAAKSNYRNMAAEMIELRDSDAWALCRPSNQTVAEHIQHGEDRIGRLAPKVQRLLEALADKHGVSIEEERAEHAKAITAKVRKSMREGANFRAANPQFFAHIEG